MIFRLYTAYYKHGMIKIGMKPEKNRKHYRRKYSNYFAINCNRRRIKVKRLSLNSIPLITKVTGLEGEIYTECAH